MRVIAGRGRCRDQARLATDRKLRNHNRQIHTLGFDVTIAQAA